ncbi:MAG TPA: YjgN family protein [Candidatus Synoicihabitans sp.]|nr:YjgN family protein [Candidatus Synoicihabitans sp.]
MHEPPPLPPPLPEASPPARQQVPFEFRGDAREYFRIWIVNTLLTLLTLGVFSAWAKVRKRRYLRGNTRLLGHAFHYTASPRRILIGNAIVVALFLGYSFFGAVYPGIRIASLVIGVALLPWVVVRSLSFNAHHTLYRGLRLRFRPNLAHAFGVYLLLPIVVVLTLGLYYPAWVRRKHQFQSDNHRYGDAFFAFDGDNGPFFAAILVGGAIVIGGAMLGGTAIASWTIIGKSPPPPLATVAIMVATYGTGFFIGRHYIHPRIFNHVWNHVRLDEHRFVARMAPGRWLGLQCIHLLAVVATCGLAYPWVTIRNTRFALESLSLDVVDLAALDRIEAFGLASGHALGESAAEFAGMDFGL